MCLTFIISTVGKRLPELRRLLRSLQEEVPNSRVFIADQSPDSGVSSLAAEFSVARIVASTGGLSRGRNDCLASGALDGPGILMFPNDNTSYPTGLLLAVQERMTSLDLDVLAGHLVYEDGSSPFPVPPGRTVLDRDNAALAMSATLAVRSSCFTKGLRFDESLGTGAPSPHQAGEETDLLLNILRDGGRAELHSDLVVCGQDATRQLPVAEQVKKTWAYSRAHTHVLRRHGFSWKTLVLTLLRPLVRSLLGLATLNGRQSLLAMTRFLGRCRGLAP